MVAAPPEYKPYRHVETRFGIKTLNSVVASPENICGYCHYHRGYLTKREYKSRRCKQRNCNRFREVSLDEIYSKAREIIISEY